MTKGWTISWLFMLLGFNCLVMGQTTAPSSWAPLVGTITGIEGEYVAVSVNLPDGDFQIGHLLTEEKTRVFLPDEGASTKASESLREGKLQELQPGMKVKVTFSGTGAADKIIVLNPPPQAIAWPTTRPTTGTQRISGTLVKIDAGNLTIQTFQHESDGTEMKRFVISTNENTLFNVDVFPAQLQDMTVGMSVNCVAQPPSRSHPQRLSIFATSLDGITGTIVKIDGKKIVLNGQTSGGGIAEQTVITDDQTKIMFITVPADRSKPRPIQARRGEFDQLQAGMQVRVTPGTGTAARIVVHIVTNNPTSRPGP